ncbi:MAG TPA: DUF2520 domain-containing protein [Actinomycetota bacterium]|nr:DUF2520 domain-containing protein [Actinomycetota bacterium]
MSSLPAAHFRFALIGAGRVGTAVACLLKLAGHQPVAVASRSAASAEEASRRLECPIAAPPEMDAEVYLIGTGLDAIPDVAALIPSVEGKPVIHFAGVTGTEPLSGAIERGGLACALHPVQACPEVDIAIQRLPGSAWGVTCSPDAQAWAVELIAQGLGGRPVEVPEEGRALWHAAAVVTSNGIAALMAAGEMMIEQIGIADPASVLGPIAVGTAENARLGGGGAATLTGPVVRGEADTLSRHLESLRGRPEHLNRLYRDVSAFIVQAAEISGRIDPAIAKQMYETLR